jgi:hypothetical protein
VPAWRRLQRRLVPLAAASFAHRASRANIPELTYRVRRGPAVATAAGMTPHQLFRETTSRPRRSWPPYAWAIVAGAAIAMFVSVTLLAWEASRENVTRDRIRDMSDGPFESADEIRQRLESECRAVDEMRATQSGIYAPDFNGARR